MPTSRKADYSGRAFAVPMGLILGLIVAYWLLTNWHVLPRLISLTVAAFS
jgi:hypothetical protein